MNFTILFPKSFESVEENKNHIPGENVKFRELIHIDRL